MTKGRPPIPHFPPDELLFRRFPPRYVSGAHVDIAAIELPDMSCNRGSLGPQEWLLIGFEDWGVFQFLVADIPPQQLEQGVISIEFSPAHVPLKNNYPHSEVRAYRDGQHIDQSHAGLLSRQADVMWRQRLLWKTRIRIFPRPAH
jgi:hypothetical protein